MHQDSLVLYKYNGTLAVGRVCTIPRGNLVADVRDTGGFTLYLMNGVEMPVFSMGRMVWQPVRHIAVQERFFAEVRLSSSVAFHVPDDGKAVFGMLPGVDAGLHAIVPQEAGSSLTYVPVFPSISKLYPSGLSASDAVPVPTFDAGWLLGAVTTDGVWRKSIQIFDNRREMGEGIHASVASVLGPDVVIEEIETPSDKYTAGIKYVLSGPGVQQYVEYLYKYAGDSCRKLSDLNFVYTAPEEFRHGFVTGVLDSRFIPYKSRRDKTQIYMYSRKIADIVYNVLRTLGVSSSIHRIRTRGSSTYMLLVSWVDIIKTGIYRDTYSPTQRARLSDATARGVTRHVRVPMPVDVCGLLECYTHGVSRARLPAFMRMCGQDDLLCRLDKMRDVLSIIRDNISRVEHDYALLHHDVFNGRGVPDMELWAKALPVISFIAHSTTADVESAGISAVYAYRTGRRAPLRKWFDHHPVPALELEPVLLNYLDTIYNTDIQWHSVDDTLVLEEPADDYSLITAAGNVMLFSGAVVANVIH